MKYEDNTWYWFTHYSEGDSWHPIFMNDEGTFYMDGEFRDVNELNEMTVVKAIMPRYNSECQHSIDYGDGIESRLCLQVGDKGRAVVI